jgi:Ca-activated chloride channel homolog
MIEKSPMHSVKIWPALGLLFALLNLPSGTIKAQVSVTPQVLDFGTTSPQTTWVRDIYVTNHGDKKDYLLRHTFSHEYAILLSTKTIEPDSTMVLRVQFKPRANSLYNEHIKLYFASMKEPLEIVVKADVHYLNPDDHLPCPDFTVQLKDCCPNFFFIAEVLDASTGQGIPAAKIEFEPINGTPLQLKTNKDGIVTREMPIFYYYIKASAPGYEVAYREQYINLHNNRLQMELKPLPPLAATPPIKIDTLPAPVAPIDSTALAVPPIDPILLHPSLASNNVVFLLDISSSMAKDEKMALMKASIHELSKVLRPQDQIALLAYADQTKILMTTTSGDQKEMVVATADALEASGKTNGAIGFKTAYKTLQSSYLKNANNQLYVITDGAFATVDQELIKKQVRRANRKGINTSIISIQANIFAQKNLSEVAQLGDGQLISIEASNDLPLIVEDLKLHCITP